MPSSRLLTIRWVRQYDAFDSRPAVGRPERRPHVPHRRENRSARDDSIARGTAPAHWTGLILARHRSGISGIAAACASRWLDRGWCRRLSWVVRAAWWDDWPFCLSDAHGNPIIS